MDQRKTGEESGQKVSSQNERAALDEKQAKGKRRAETGELVGGKSGTGPCL
jgi:hypothetical protein